MSSAEKVLEEAGAKLACAIKAGDIHQIGISHGLLEVARKRMSNATEELCSIAMKRKKNSEKMA